jgi:hypothetical protein
MTVSLLLNNREMKILYTICYKKNNFNDIILKPDILFTGYKQAPHKAIWSQLYLKKNSKPLYK